MLSVTMYESATRVYLDPPLDKVREIQLLDCRIPKRLVNFKDRQGLLKEDNRPFIIIEPGTYSLRSIHAIFLNDTDNAKLSIIETDTVDYLYSNKSFNTKFTRGLQIGLGVPEVIKPGKLYPINVQIKEPLRLTCSLVDNRSSYMNNARFAGPVKISPSYLLANIPSQDYPVIPAQKLKTPINHFDLSILDSEWKKLDLNGSPITVSLRFR